MTTNKSHFMRQLAPTLGFIGALSIGIALVSCGDKQGAGPRTLARDAEKVSLDVARNDSRKSADVTEITPTAAPKPEVENGNKTTLVDGDLVALQLVQKHCTGCHMAGGQASFLPLTNLEQIRAERLVSAERLKSTARNQMPPAYGSAEQKTFEGDTRQFLVNWLLADPVFEPAPVPTATPTPVPTATPAPVPVPTPSSETTRALKIMDVHCVSCHNVGGMAEFALLNSLASIKSEKVASAARLLSTDNPMPPSYGSSEQTTFAGDDKSFLIDWLKNSPDLK